MKLISKRKFRVELDGEEYIVPAINSIVFAPDWVADDVYYQALKRAGLVTPFHDDVPESKPVKVENTDKMPDQAQDYTLGALKTTLHLKNLGEAAALVEDHTGETLESYAAKQEISAEVFNGVLLANSTEPPQE